ncbi:MAG: hypothetical protein ACE5H1_06690 [Thermodesulfobacteriota bacterium]
MSTAIPWIDCASISNFPTVGFGPDSLKLEEYYYSIVREFRKAETLGRMEEALQSLNEVVMECSEKGWDGYDARPIAEAAYNDARRLIENLPLTSFIPMPEIIPEPGGEIGLEWSKGSRQVFVVSVIGDNEVIYAGLFGTNKTHGTEYFGDSLPSIVIENLKRLYH